MDGKNDLFDPWFDVTKGAYDSVEVCGLTGAFLLDKISVKYDKNRTGLYRDNGLSLFKNSTSKSKKELTKTFKYFGLEIVAESNLRLVNHLDVTTNLNNGSCRRCHKPDDIQYINKEFNHSPTLINHLPASIEKRFSNNASDEKLF